MTMPTIDVKDWNNKKVGSVELSDEIFGYPYKEHLIHEAVRNYLASLRQGTHKVKNRSEVAGSGKKPFRQKGTGRAGRNPPADPPPRRHRLRPRAARLLLQDERAGEEGGAQVGALAAGQGREARAPLRPQRRRGQDQRRGAQVR